MIHYALVSDLMTREEFEERVEEKSTALGGVVDEVTAAMLVVEDLGRSHVKIGDIPKAEAAVVSFFGKILSIDGPREFRREGEDPGMLATLVLGDPTGTTKTTLWDERAAAVTELSVGQVVEVIGKPRFGRKEVSFVAMRESAVEIVETKKPPTSEELTTPFVVKILYMAPVKEIVRKNGDIAQVQVYPAAHESLIALGALFAEIRNQVNGAASADSLPFKAGNLATQSIQHIIHRSFLKRDSGNDHFPQRGGYAILSLSILLYHGAGFRCRQRHGVHLQGQGFFPCFIHVGQSILPESITGSVEIFLPPVLHRFHPPAGGRIVLINPQYGFKSLLSLIIKPQVMVSIRQSKQAVHLCYITHMLGRQRRIGLHRVLGSG